MPQPADTTRTAPVAGGTSVAPDAGDRWHPRSAGIDAATTAAATIVAHTAATANDAIATDTHSLLHPTSPHAGSCHAQQHAKPSSQGDTKLRPARAVTTKTPAPHGMATRRTHSHAVYARQYDALPGIGAGVPTCPSIRHLLIRFNTDTPHYPQCRTSCAAQQQSQSQHQHQPLHPHPPQTTTPTSNTIPTTISITHPPSPAPPAAPRRSNVAPLTSSPH